jgi:hypothetical protein
MRIEQILADDAAIGEAEAAADDLHMVGFFRTQGPGKREEVLQ